MDWQQVVISTFQRITGYKVHIFTTTGTMTTFGRINQMVTSVEYLVVAGGGGCGSAQYGGGGGAGGLRTKSLVDIH